MQLCVCVRVCVRVHVRVCVYSIGRYWTKINCIQNKNKKLYLLCIYKYTHMHVYIYEKFVFIHCFPALIYVEKYI